mmetsp:Transcript_645/g.1407  ORF Transcript_645/g.1407 Transcript_645/m.1407 type:complete len:310 (+) Transcript_645:1214-2143(+)
MQNQITLHMKRGQNRQTRTAQLLQRINTQSGVRHVQHPDLRGHKTTQENAHACRICKKICSATIDVHNLHTGIWAALLKLRKTAIVQRSLWPAEMREPELLNQTSNCSSPSSTQQFLHHVDLHSLKNAEQGLVSVSMHFSHAHIQNFQSRCTIFQFAQSTDPLRVSAQSVSHAQINRSQRWQQTGRWPVQKLSTLYGVIQAQRCPIINCRQHKLCGCQLLCNSMIHPRDNTFSNWDLKHRAQQYHLNFIALVLAVLRAEQFYASQQLLLNPSIRILPDHSSTRKTLQGVCAPLEIKTIDSGKPLTQLCC